MQGGGRGTGSYFTSERTVAIGQQAHHIPYTTHVDISDYMTRAGYAVIFTKHEYQADGRIYKGKQITGSGVIEIGTFDNDSNRLYLGRKEFPNGDVQFGVFETNQQKPVGIWQGYKQYKQGPPSNPTLRWEAGIFQTEHGYNNRLWKGRKEFTNKDAEEGTF